MANKYEFVDEDSVLREIPLPTDWSVDVERGVWMVRARSKDGFVGVAEYGATKAEALEKLRKRMRDWQRDRDFGEYGSGRKTNYD